jgi:hypothetical protein
VGVGAQTAAVPQANNLTLVRAVVEGVAAGISETAKLSRYTKLSPRHVRYYLLAAETLEWLDLSRSRPEITARGRFFLTLQPQSREEADAIASAISISPAIRDTVGDYLRGDIDQDALTIRLVESTNLAPATAGRRAACLVAWRSQLEARGWRPEPVPTQRVEEVMPLFGVLSIRAQNVLDRLGVTKVEELASMSRATLQKRPNCGRKTIGEIVAWAESRGVSLEGEGDKVPTPDARGGPIDSVEALPMEMLLSVSDVSLSVRARGCLEKLGVHHVGDLVSLTPAKLLKVPNCGRTTIRELKEALSSLGLSLAMQVPVWKEIDVPDLARQHATTLVGLRRKRSATLYAVDSSSGVGQEVKSALAAVLKTAELAKVELWIGLDHRDAPTLQEVGEVADVTRERIRQIVEKAKTKIAAADLKMSRLRSAVRLLEDAPVLLEPTAASLIESGGLSASTISARGLLRAAEFFGVATRVQRARIGGRGFVGTPEALAAIKAVLRMGRRAIEQWGCSTVEDICAQLNSEGSAEIPPSAVKEALMTQPGFRWLDEHTGWFWLADIPRNRVLSKIDKILAAAPSVDLSALRAGIARHYRMEGFAPPTRVLRALCEQLDDCEVIDGTTIVDKRPREPQIELSEQERVMVDIFRTHGPVLSFPDAIRHCLDAGLNETTTAINLSGSPVLRRVVMGVYTLVGASVTPGEIEAVAKTVSRGRRSQIVQDFGWHPDGTRIWATYKISAGMLRSGVVGVPAGIRKYLDSSGYDLRGSDDSAIGRIRLAEANMWGFLPFFRRRGGEAGDFLRVTFNLSERRAVVEVAEEPFEETMAAPTEKRSAG